MYRTLSFKIGPNLEDMKPGAKTVKPLQDRAKAAWRNHINNELKWERLITRQMFVLLERVYHICGDQYEVNVILEGELVSAHVDGLVFISTYYELDKDPPDKLSDRSFGVRLWWRCEKCCRVITSAVIYTDYDLGQQLEIFKPQRSHKCRRKSK